MRTAEITPMILTFNEAANLRRTLMAVSWAKQILIVDSFSSDETLSIAAEFPQVTVVQRHSITLRISAILAWITFKTDWVCRWTPIMCAQMRFTRRLSR